MKLADEFFIVAVITIKFIFKPLGKLIWWIAVSVKNMIAGAIDSHSATDDNMDA